MPPSSPPSPPFPPQPNPDDLVLVSNDLPTGHATSSSHAHVRANAHTHDDDHAHAPGVASSSKLQVERIAPPGHATPEDIEMVSVGHRRRRSSILNPIVVPTRTHARSASQAIPLQDDVKIVEEGDDEV